MMLCVYMCQGLCFLYVTQTYTAFAIPSSLSVYTAQSSDIKERKRNFTCHVPWLGDPSIMF